MQHCIPSSSSIALVVSQQVPGRGDYRLESAALHKCGKAQTCPSNEATLPALQVRTQQALPWSAYSFSTCVAYALYPPLYIAGPILPFNAFASQLQRPMLPALAQVRDVHQSDRLPTG